MLGGEINIVQACMNLEKLIVDWKNLEKTRLEEKKKRRYLHFDARIPIVGKGIVEESTNPKKVSGRFFYPFIKNSRVDRRFKWGQGDKKIVEKKERDISYASHRDAFIFSWYAYMLNYIYVKLIKKIGLNDNVTAYRSIDGKNNLDFAEEAFQYIKKRQECAALCFDISGFFDNLDHSIAKKRWAYLLSQEEPHVDSNLPKDHFNVYKTLSHYSFVELSDLYNLFNIKRRQTRHLEKICSHEEFINKVRKSDLIHRNKEKKGLPQGNPVSVVISNAYMLDFDKSVAEMVSEFGGFYRRYSDDIIIVCAANQINSVKEKVKYEIENLKLEIKESKTEVRLFTINADGKIVCRDEHGNKSLLQYLGCTSDGENYRLREKTKSKFYKRMTKVVKREVYLAKKYSNGVVRKGKIKKKFIHDRKRSFLTYSDRFAEKFQSEELKKQMSKKVLAKRIAKRIKKYTKS